MVAYHFCRHDDTSRSNPRRMLCSIAFQLAKSFPKYSEALVTLNLTRADLLEENITGLFKTLFIEPLHKLVNPSNKKRVILIDALDECDHEGGKNDILQCIAKYFDKLPEWLGVYVTTRPETPITSKLKKFHPTELHPEEQRNIEDIRIFFQHILRKVCDTEIKDGTYEAAVEVLVRKSKGLFIYASIAAEKLEDEFSSSNIPSIADLEQYPDGLDEFYEIQLERIVEDTECLEWQAIQFITAAREPLHVTTIQTLLKCSDKERNQLTAKLSRFYPIRNKKIYAYHKSLKDWLYVHLVYLDNIKHKMMQTYLHLSLAMLPWRVSRVVRVNRQQVVP